MPNGKAFGILARDGKYIYIIHSKSGEIEIFPASSENTNLLKLPNKDEVIHHVFAVGQDPNQDNFILAEGYYRDSSTKITTLSFDGKFLADLIQPGNSYTKIILVSEETSFNATDPNDSLYDISFSWQPNQALLAILQNTNEVGRGKPKGNYRLIIYDPEKNSVISSYENVKGSQWSQDGLQILYESQGAGFYGDAYDYGSVPCIFTLLNQATNCLNFIRNFHGQIGLFDYTFSPDSSKISYTYSYVIQDPYQELGGLCITKFDPKTIVCPTDNIPEVRGGGRYGLNVLSHSWSPDGKYISFIIGGGCPRCDTGSAHPQIVIISTDDNNYLLLDETTNDRYPGLWRPTITD